MCGIVGFFERNRLVTAERVQSACETIRHRGPDSQGIHIDRGFGFGMTRLAIIDLVSGAQPIFSDDQRYAIVFNGEIYNYRELRAELSDFFSFRTQSDTEVVLRAFERWGTNCFQRLNGMFAIAIWDRSKRRLTIARDPVGIKPLYYTRSPGTFAFSSELKTFSRIGLANTADFQSILQSLSFGYVSHPRTSLKGVCSLPQGHYIEVSEESISEPKLFSDPFSPAANSEKSDFSEDQLLNEIQKAILRQTVSDVDFGIFLSAGIDSMMIFETLRRAGKMDRVSTFTADFENPSFSEYSYVSEIARKYGFRNHRVVLKSEDVKQNWEKVCAASDNLEFLPTSIGMYLLSETAAHEVKMVLSGNGGDELFYGYPTYTATRLHDRFYPFSRGAGMLRPTLSAFSQSESYLSLHEKALRFSKAANKPTELAHLTWRHFFSHDELTLLVQKDRLASESVLFADQLRYYPKSDRSRPIEHYRYVDTKTWLVDGNLSFWDKTGMASSLEIRVPLLDLKLLEYVKTIPAEKLRLGLGKKGLLRKIADGFLDPKIVHMKKHGFQVPVSDWLRKELKQTFKEAALDLPTSHFNRAEIERLWREHEARKQDHGLKLWVLGCISQWSKVLNVTF